MTPTQLQHAAELLRTYRSHLPEDAWQRIRPFVTATVAAADLASPTLVRRALICVAQYGHWLVAAGYGTEAAWEARLIDYYTEMRAQTLTAPVVEYERKLLRRLGGIDTAARECRPRNRVTIQVDPYAAVEVAQIRRWATHRAERRGIVALALGCGLTRGETARTRTADIIRLSDGRHAVHVHGDRERVVPVRAEFEEWLAEAAASPESYPFHPAAKDRIKTLTEIVQRRLTFQRARATWLLAHLSAGVPLNLLADVAGVTHFATLLVRLLPFLAPVNNDTAIAALRGEVA